VISGGRIRGLSLPTWLKVLGWAAAVLMALTVALVAWASVR